ncbi:MAG: ParB/RepB/Spo0J family partition protein [Bacilli bacterium]
MAKKKALGKGLDALFNEEGINLDTLDKVEKSVDNEEIFELDIDTLRPNPYQPRKHFDESSLNDLASSIAEHGIFQPLIVKKSVKGYEIVAGERRFRAASIVGLKTVPVVVREFGDQQMMEIALLENLQRENLNGIEEAKAYELMLSKLEITQSELSKRVGKSRTHITNTLGILRLPIDIQKHVVDGKISTAHARILSKFEDETEIRKIMNNIVDGGLSVRDVEKLRSKKVSPPKAKKDIHVIEAENKLCEKLNTKVVIDKNKLVINYNSIEELEMLIDKLVK